ncbi:DUF4347 domain-containing protein [Snuella lapsa]|uniref:DUF4347 domain-containing protein n=1 Tax=Snuella lapsa TaxID=870481 RepID=A0ABP6Y2N0_9FLAO
MAKNYFKSSITLNPFHGLTFVIWLLACTLKIYAITNTEQLKDSSYNNLTEQTIFYVDSSLYDKEFLQNEIKCSNGDVSTYHVFSHGKPGELFINGDWLNSFEIERFLKSRIQGLKSAINHINIYGCNFAKGEKGKQAVAYLEAALGVSVAASDDITGIDGDWELEITAEANPVRSIAVPGWKHNLQTASLSATKTSSVDFAVVGERIQYTVDVTNNGDATATNLVVNDLLPEGVTYGPGTAYMNPTIQTEDFEAGAGGWTGSAGNGKPPVVMIPDAFVLENIKIRSFFVLFDELFIPLKRINENKS